MKSNIKLIRLLNGEELMAEVSPFPDSNSVIQLKNVIRIVMIPPKGPGQEPTVGLAPFCQYSNDKEFEFQLSHILVMMNPIPEFLNQYQSLFGKLMTPQKSIILP